VAGLLNHQEIPRGWADFKDRWYAVAAALEALKDLGSGLDEGFSQALEDIGREVEEVSHQGETLVASVMRIAPEQAAVLREGGGVLGDALSGVAEDIHGILSRIREHREVSGPIPRLREDLKALEKEFKEKDALARKVAVRLKEAREGYEAKVRNIKDTTDRKLAALRDDFIGEMAPIFDGYDIVGETTMDVGALFEALVEDPAFHQKVTVVSRGFGLGKKKADAAARTLLLGYKGRELASRISPLLEEEERRIRKFDKEKEEVARLEAQAGDLEREAGSLKTWVDSLKRELTEQEARAARLQEEFGGYDQVLSIRDRLLERFNQGREVVKSLGHLVEESVEGYEPEERDVEKRELKAELKVLREERDDLKKERDDLESRLQALSREVEEYGREMERITKTLNTFKAERGALESENTSLKAELERTAADLEKALDRAAASEEEAERARRELEATVNDLEKAINRYEATKKELEDYKKALEKRDQEYQDLKEKYEESSAELEDLRSEIQRLDEEMLARIKALESDIRKQTSGMLRARTKKTMSREERHVEEKLNALRDKKV
jgi:chromosome segregation ATPase